jgi:hypothetical protein
MFLAGCLNVLDPPNVRERDGLVRIEIGGGQVRTVQPSASALAGYRLTFSGGHDPVDITGGTSAEVYLADGTYTITATAYKAGGQIGNAGDVAASGSIAVTLSNAVVVSNGGVVPPIILGPGSTGNGTLEYTISGADAVKGTMSLWKITTTGTDLVDAFGTSGVLAIGAAPALSAETFDLAAGRYIAEIRLENGNGDIALLREVVEIWAGTTTALVFEPKDYLDPSALAALSGAALSEATIGDVKITMGSGSKGSGEGEGDPISYDLEVSDIANVSLDFVQENDSLFAEISWTATTGAAPGGAGYSTAPLSNFSTNHVLWVKVVSEDRSTTRYYRFTLSQVSSISAPTTNAEHLAMLKNLGVDVNPGLPVAPNGQTYDPYASSGSARSARAVGGASRGVPGPLGKIFSWPKREIFAAGYALSGGKFHALYEDFGNRSDLTLLGQDSGNDSGWAAYVDSNPHKSVAADLNGDGIDEVVVVTLVRATNKILVNKGVYNGSAFTVTQVREVDAPAAINSMLPEDVNNLQYVGWKLISADLDGDGMQECILTLPGVNEAYMYVLDNNLALTQLNIQPYTSGLPSGTGWRWFPMVTAADYDQDGKDEICLTIGVNTTGFNAPYIILDDKDNGYRELSKGTVGNTGARLKIGNLVAADFTGDGIPDTAFYGIASDNGNNHLLLLKTTIDSAFKPVFTWVEAANKTLSTDHYIIPRLAAGDVDGDRKADLCAQNILLTFSEGNNQFEQMAGTSDVFIYKVAYGDYYDVVMGDVTGDRKDDVVLFYGFGEIQIYYYDSGQYKRYQTQISNVGSYTEAGCLPNVDDDSFILRDTGQRELLFTDPEVIAVLASPPYYEGVNGDGDGGTSFGYSKSSGTSESNAFGFSVGVSVGHEFNVPLIGTGTEFEASLKSSFSWAQSNSIEISESWGWNTPVAQDLVIFTAIPFDVYYYEVLRSPSGEDARPGDILTVSVPRKPLPYHAPLEFYNRGVTEENQVAVNHTLGVPQTYYTPTQRDAQKAAAGNKGLFSTNTQMTAGIGQGSTTINIEKVSGQESSFAFDLETEIAGKVKVGGVSIGASVGFSYGYESTTSVSEGTWIEGTVPAIPTESYESDMDFRWGLMAYPRKDPYQSYVFVTYWLDHN